MTASSGTARSSGRSPGGQLALLEFRAAVASTAAALAHARGQGAGGATALVLARRNHVTALTAYESALRAMRLPVPRRLRDDLRLLSGVVSLTEKGPIAYSRSATPGRHG